VINKGTLYVILCIHNPRIFGARRGLKFACLSDFNQNWIFPTKLLKARNLTFH